MSGDDDEALLRQARFGVALRRELQDSAVVKVIRAAARRSAEQAMAELVELDAARVDEVRRLQHEVRRYRDLDAWIEQALGQGDEALRLLEEHAADLAEE